MSAITVKQLKEKIRDLKQSLKISETDTMQSLRERDSALRDYRNLMYTHQREEKILNHIIGFHGRD